MHLARAQFKCGKLAECKKTLLRARHVAPHDSAVLYNVSCVLMQVGKSVLVDGKSNLQTVMHAISDLKLAQESVLFVYLIYNVYLLSYDIWSQTGSRVSIYYLFKLLCLFIVLHTISDLKLAYKLVFIILYGL